MAFMSSGTKVAEMIGFASAAFLIGILGLGGAIIVDALPDGHSPGCSCQFFKLMGVSITHRDSPAADAGS